MEPLDPNEPLTPKQKALIAAAKREEMMRMMQKKAAGMSPKYPDDAKKQKPKGFKKGGRVRGCGIARKGLTRGKMR